MISCAPSFRRLVCGVLLLAAGGASAVELQEMHVQGFVSQGWLNTRRHNYLVVDSRDGSTEFNEMALSMQVQASNKLRVGAQFLARDFGNTGNGVVRLDWAYGDYNWRDWLNIRAGKIKTVTGLYGEGRDIDMLRTTVLLPQSVYPEEHRDFILGVEGLGIHGNIPLSEAGGLDYDLWAGTLNVAETGVGFWGDIFGNVGIGVAEELSTIPGYQATYLGSSDEQVRFRYLSGGSAFWNSPLSGFRAGVTFLKGRFTTRSRDLFSLTSGDGSDITTIQDVSLENRWEGRLNHLLYLSAEWMTGPWILAGEYHQERVDGTTGEGYYGQLTYQACDRLALAGYGARSLRDRKDADGRLIALEGFPEHLAWQNDYCAAARVDVTDNWLIKGEFHVVDGLARLPRAQNPDRNTWHRWWSYAAVKATFHF